MDIDLTYQGDGTKSDTIYSLLDGFFEGLTALVFYESKVKNNEQIDRRELEKGWEELSTLLKAHSLNHTKFKNNVEKETWEDGIKPDIQEILIAQATIPEMFYEKTLIWTDEKTTIQFNNQFDVGYHSLILKGTKRSIKESLVFFLFYFLIQEFKIDNEHDFVSAIDKLVEVEVKRTEKYRNEPEYFERYFQPWLDEIEKLSK